MSKLDEIKKRLTPGSRIPYSHPFDLADTFKQDAEYLLSKLEEVEKVFEELTEASLHYRIGGVEEIAAEALKKLRS